MRTPPFGVLDSPVVAKNSSEESTSKASNKLSSRYAEWYGTWVTGMKDREE